MDPNFSEYEEDELLPSPPASQAHIAFLRRLHNICESHGLSPAAEKIFVYWLHGHINEFKTRLRFNENHLGIIRSDNNPEYLIIEWPGGRKSVNGFINAFNKTFHTDVASPALADYEIGRTEYSTPPDYDAIVMAVPYRFLNMNVLPLFERYLNYQRTRNYKELNVVAEQCRTPQRYEYAGLTTLTHRFSELAEAMDPLTLTLHDRIYQLKDCLDNMIGDPLTTEPQVANCRLLKDYLSSLMQVEDEVLPPRWAQLAEDWKSVYLEELLSSRTHRGYAFLSAIAVELDSSNRLMHYHEVYSGMRFALREIEMYGSETSIGTPAVERLAIAWNRVKGIWENGEIDTQHYTIMVTERLVDTLCAQLPKHERKPGLTL